MILVTVEVEDHYDISKLQNWIDRKYDITLETTDMYDQIGVKVKKIEISY
jgi:hypothetical protein